MVALQINTVQQMSPKSIPASHFLSKATKKAASSFALGDKTISLDIDPHTPQAAIVNEFKLSAAASRSLGRSVNVIEGVASAITAGSNAENEIKTYLTRVKTPANITNNSSFYFVTVRSRNTAVVVNPIDYLDLNKRLPTARTQNFILGLHRNSKKQLVVTLLHPTYKLAGKKRKGGATIVTFPLTDNTSAAQQPPSTAAQPDPDNTQDFAACYSSCLNNIPPFLLALAGAVCTTCAAAIATTPISAPALAVACSACAIAIGIVLGNCLLNCHEML
jgi:hypothetical protein